MDHPKHDTPHRRGTTSRIGTWIANKVENLVVGKQEDQRIADEATRYLRQQTPQPKKRGKK